MFHSLHGIHLILFTTSFLRKEILDKNFQNFISFSFVVQSLPIRTYDISINNHLSIGMNLPIIDFRCKKCIRARVEFILSLGDIISMPIRPLKPLFTMKYHIILDLFASWF